MSGARAQTIAPTVTAILSSRLHPTLQPHQTSSFSFIISHYLLHACMNPLTAVFKLSIYCAKGSVRNDHYHIFTIYSLVEMFPHMFAHAFFFLWNIPLFSFLTELPALLIVIQLMKGLSLKTSLIRSRRDTKCSLFCTLSTSYIWLCSY